MNWYKKSQAMFQTFGLEEKLTKAFIQAYNSILIKNSLKTINRKFDKEKFISLGNYDLSESFKPIIDYYGKPKMRPPKEINFVIVKPHVIKSVGETIDFGAFFAQTTKGFFIGEVLENFMELTIEYKNFIYSIAHELQHFLKTLYGNKVLGYSHKYNNAVIDYVSEPCEIQAHSRDIAKRAIDDIKELFAARMQSLFPQEKRNVIEKIKKDKDQLIKRFFVFEIKNFFELINKNALTNELPQEIKKQYYISALKNFNVLFDRFIEEISF
jgi:hypothetical protein